jgi:hypothetical protein
LKRRYLYVLMFGVPALLAATIVSVLLFAAAAGFLWLFVLGDNPWPSSADTLLTSVLVLVWVGLSAALKSLAYVYGKGQEGHAALDTRHVVAAAAATALLVLLVLSHQWRVGNIGPQSDGAMCAEFCQRRGFAGSGMPPRDAGAATCSCFDTQGREVVKVPMAEVAARPGN